MNQKHSMTTERPYDHVRQAMAVQPSNFQQIVNKMPVDKWNEADERRTADRSLENICEAKYDVKIVAMQIEAIWNLSND